MLPGHMSPRNEMPLVRFSGRMLPLHTIVTRQLTAAYLTNESGSRVYLLPNLVFMSSSLTF